MPLALANDQIERWLDLSQAMTLYLTLHLPLDSFGVRQIEKAVTSPREKDIAKIEPR